MRRYFDELIQQLHVKVTELKKDIISPYQFGCVSLLTNLIEKVKLLLSATRETLLVCIKGDKSIVSELVTNEFDSDDYDSEMEDSNL